MSVRYGPPPDTDSEDEYDGFYFGNDIPKSRPVYHHVVDKESQLSSALISGDCGEFKHLMKQFRWPVDKPIHGHMTPLQLAATWGNLELVKYIVNELKAGVGFSLHSMPPIMLVCQSTHQPSEVLVDIVDFLVKKGAQVDIKDMHKCTPLMAAAGLGHVHIVRYILKTVPSYSILEAVDNTGGTALYHAIENNKPEVVRALLEAGANTDIINNKGYSPWDAAQFYGFDDLLEILPRPVKPYIPPIEYVQYNIFRDYIPQIFGKTANNTAYSPEIVSILRKAGKMSFLPYFANAHISLESFLNLNDEDMIDLGLDLPIQRNVLKRLLLRYFLEHWKEEPIVYLTPDEGGEDDNNCQTILLRMASQLRQVVVLKCTLRYIRQNLEDGLFGPVREDVVMDFQETVTKYKASIAESKALAAQLNSLSPSQNPLYINYDDYIAEKDRRRKKRATFKHTMLAVGISVMFYLRYRKFF